MAIVIVLVPGQTTVTNASIRPIITTKMPHELIIGLQDVNLTWYVIDDNLMSYTIFINDSLWKMDNFTNSNVLEVTFSNVIGFYNLTLSVHDYSGYNSNASQYIKVLQLPNTSATQSVTSTINNQTKASASNGFEFISVILVITISSVIKLKRKKKQ